MKKKMLDLFGQGCFALGTFLIFYVGAGWFFARVHFAPSPRNLLCIIAVVTVGLVGFVIQSSRKKS